MKKKVLIPIALVLVIAAGIYFYSFSNSTTTNDIDVDQSLTVDDVETQPADTIEADTEEPDSSNKTAVTVEGGMFYFEPNIIEAKVGQKITVNFKNIEGIHDFVIDELNAKTEIIKAGEEQTIEFTPNKAGEFEYYCSVGSHRAQGMVGKLIVTE